MSEDQALKVTVAYGDVKAEFDGTPEAVLLSITNFIIKQIPTMDLASRISINYSTEDLLKMFEKYVKITPEGPRIWFESSKLSDKDLVTLQLVAGRTGQATTSLP